MGNLFTTDTLQLIAHKPHVLGHIVGKTKLTMLHSDWIKYIWPTKVSRSLQAHRGSYKTTAIAEVGAIVWMLFHPDDRIAIVRKTFSAAAEVVQTIGIMMRMPEVQMLFKIAHGFYPKAVVDREGKLLFNFKSTVTPEGSVTAHGLDYGLTGKHYDRILLDDFVTLKDRISKAEREKSKEVLREVMTNIIDPGQPVCYIGTPWHKADGWELCPEPIKFDVVRAGLLSPVEIEQKRKTTTPVLYAANYLLEHQADDQALFRDPTYARWDLMVKNNVGQLDAAFDGDHFNAFTIMGKKPDGRIQAIGKTNAGNIKDWLDKVAEIHKKYRCTLVHNETNPDKGFTADALEKRGVRTKTYQEKQNKHLKISTHLYQHWNNIDWDPDTDDEYMEQILDYREGQEPDDAPDSAASLLRESFSTKGNNSILWEW